MVFQKTEYAKNENVERSSRMNGKQQITIYLPSEIILRVERLAIRNKKSRNAMLVSLIVSGFGSWVPVPSQKGGK